jgi:multiple sugar transport system ATP-binding protein
LSGVALEGVTRRHGAVTALDAVTLEVADGELLCVLGPSGSGKTTLLRIVSGLDEPDAGTVRIGERAVNGVPAVQRDVAMVFQSFALFPHLNVADNVGFGLAARGTPAAERRAQVAAAARALGIEGLLERAPGELSGGERQRVALARGLVRRPAALLLDEPLSNLDAQLRAETRAELRRVHDLHRLTTIHVTHDQAEALSLGDRVAILREGRLQQHGTPDEVYDRPANAWVAGFLGSPPMNLVPADAWREVTAAEAASTGGPRAAGPTPAGPTPAATIGIRPEHFQPDPSGPLRARLEAVEAAGHERIWRVTAGEVRLAVRVGVDRTERPGDEVRLSVVRVHGFDAGGRAL